MYQKQVIVGGGWSPTLEDVYSRTDPNRFSLLDPLSEAQSKHVCLDVVLEILLVRDHPPAYGLAKFVQALT